MTLTIRLSPGPRQDYLPRFLVALGDDFGASLMRGSPAAGR
jgi:hypothetical protein